MFAARAGRAACAVLTAVFLLVLAGPAGAQEPGGVTQTPFGPLGPADRDLLVKVRQAGLWEGQAGTAAGVKGDSARVKEIGPEIARQHSALDEFVRRVATQLDVPLPNQPSAEQQGWLDELATKSGPEFDQTFANRLRAAHGKVLPVIAQVLSGTRNDVIRAFARHAGGVVTGHMEMLESTGLVNFAALPEPPAPTSSTSQAGVRPAPSEGGGVTGLVAIALVVAGVFSTIGLLRVLRS